MLFLMNVQEIHFYMEVEMQNLVLCNEIVPEAEILKPREKMEKFGAQALNTDELLAIILGSGCKDCDVFALARNLAEFLSLETSMPTLKSLRRIKGLGRVKSIQVLACLELSSRFIMSDKAVIVNAPEDVIGRLSFLKYEMQEHLVVVLLNAANNIICIRDLTTGLVNQAPVHPREAFAEAVKERAVSVIFAHNHPSGSIEPSLEDINITRELCCAGRILKIPVLDHLVIGRSGFSSLCRIRPEIFEC